MRIANILLLLMAPCLPCFAQQKIRIDIDGAGTKSVPKITSGKGMSGDHTRPNLVLRVDLMPSAMASAGSTMLEVRIVNVSAIPRALPVSQDGIKLAAECPEHTVSNSAIFLESQADAHYLLKLGYFYGCEAFPETLVQVQPGEWVSYTTKISGSRLPKEARAQIRLVHTKYQQATDGLTSEDLGYDILEFSSWVPMPETPGANK